MMDPELRQLFERQKRVYEEVAALMDRLEKAISGGDVPALLEAVSAQNELFAAMKRNEDEIKDRVRHVEKTPEIRSAIEEMARTVQSLLEREEKSLSALKELKDATARSAARLHQGRRVLDAYRKAPPADEARFIDEDT